MCRWPTRWECWVKQATAWLGWVANSDFFYNCCFNVILNFFFIAVVIKRVFLYSMFLVMYLHGFQLGCAFLAAGALLVWNPLLLLVGQLLVFAGSKTKRKTKTIKKTKTHCILHPSSKCSGFVLICGVERAKLLTDILKVTSQNFQKKEKTTRFFLF